jgi:hypothetical protein
MNAEESDPLNAQQAQYLSELLFGLRDSLVKLSLALKDSELGATADSQHRTSQTVLDLVHRMKSGNPK